MSAFLIRAARDTDAGSAGAILSQFIDETEWMPRLHTRAEDIGFCGEMIARGWVEIAENEGRVLGFIARDGAEVNALYVAGEAQRSGVGTALLQRAQSVQSNLALWTFQANAPALAFYARLGFAETHRTDGENDEGLPDIHLKWEAL